MTGSGPRYRFSIVACARWETEFIVEWLNYYRAIGYDHVYIYCNDDTPFELYEKVIPYTFGDSPFVSFKYWQDIGAQFDMYFDFLLNHKEETEFVSFFDIDEFLRLTEFNNIGLFLKDLRSKREDDFDCVYFNWCTFGNSGHEVRPKTPVLTTYNRRENKFSNFMTKHITKTSKIDFTKIRKGAMTDFWHYWNGAGNFSEFVIVNPLGEDVRGYYDDVENTKLRIANPEYFSKMMNSAVICHYRFKSREDFLIRAQRGIRGVFEQQADLGRAYHDGRADQILAELNAVEDNFLADFWRSYVMDRFLNSVHALDGPELFVVSRNKRATQSSLSQWSKHPTVEEDASAALSGVISGYYSFHTGLEDEPWWCVDLGDFFGISEIRLYNRIDEPLLAIRASQIAIDVGPNDEQFNEVYRRQTDTPFGGADGDPLIFKPSIPIPGRYVRIRLLTRNYLHLDQVEVYGEPLPEMLRAAFVGSVDA